MNEIHDIIKVLALENIGVVDIGASGGMWPYYQKFIGSKQVQIILIEPSKVHANKLRKLYKHHGNVTVEEAGLFKTSCEKILNYSDTGGASIYTYDSEVADNYVEYHNAGNPNVQTTIPLHSAADWLSRLEQNKTLMGVKLDTQGCELDILTSASGFRDLGFICTEAPFGHRYKEQGSLSEFFRFFETNKYELFDVVINHSCFVSRGDRKQFIRRMFHLFPNLQSTHSVFKPRAMDGDIYAVKKIDENPPREDLIKRFFAFITLDYYVEAHSLVNRLEFSKSDKNIIRSRLVDLIRRNATIRDRSIILNLFYNALNSKRGNRLLRKLKIVPDC